MLALVLENLDDLVDVASRALKCTQVLRISTSPVADCGSSECKKGIKSFHERSLHHHLVSLPLRAYSKLSMPKTTFMLSNLQEILALLFPYSIVL